MNTINNIAHHLKNFGDQLVTNGTLKPEYAEIFALCAIIGLFSVVMTLLERSN